MSLSFRAQTFQKLSDSADRKPQSRLVQFEEKLDSFIHLSEVSGSSQSVRLGASSNRVEMNVNRNPILVDLHDRFQGLCSKDTKVVFGGGFQQ